MGLRDWVRKATRDDPPPDPPPDPPTSPPMSPPASPPASPPMSPPMSPPAPSSSSSSPSSWSVQPDRLPVLLDDPGLPATLRADLAAHATDLDGLGDRPLAGSPADDGWYRAALAYATWLAGSRYRAATGEGGAQLSRLLEEERDPPPCSAEEVRWLLEAGRRHDGRPTRGAGGVLGSRIPVALAEALPEADLPQVVVALRATAAALDDRSGDHGHGDDPVAELLQRVAALVSRAEPDRLPVDVLVPGDPLGDRARAVLLADRAEADVAPDVVLLAGYAGSSKPTARWRKATARSRERPGPVRTARELLECLGATTAEGLRDSDLRLVRGAVWTVAGIDEAWPASVLGGVGVAAGGRGGTPRHAALASSVVDALGQRATQLPERADAVVGQLTLLRQRIENRTLRKTIDTALAAAAGAAGLTSGQLLERSVPDLGLDAEGRSVTPVGDHTAVSELQGPAASAKLVTTWRTPTGTTVKSVPAALKADHADELAALRALAKEAKQLAGSQRTRLEELLALDRTWTGQDWAAHYVGHPVVGLTARGLLWQVRSAGEEGDGWRSGLPERTEDGWALRDHDESLTAVGVADDVRLWHPIHLPLADVDAWRTRLVDDAVRQPFKQAFRETYVLTPAEETTDVYSNRFAGHLLRYPQAVALMRTRGWSASHLGYWSEGWEGVATRSVGEEGWRASFRYDYVEHEPGGGADDALCSTDQVRFERAEPDREPRPHSLRDVPALVFSEAMRDVDLFVGVASVGADPDWADRGTERFADYWQRSSFGELTESAAMRREALARLLPRTKIADRVELGERFLLVHGRLRDYKIHLGSSNILMSPADTYLCIVPSRSERGPRVFLPFEEDGGRLAMVLSKAFLLADDTAITDPSIARQIRAGL